MNPVVHVPKEKSVEATELLVIPGFEGGFGRLTVPWNAANVISRDQLAD
jgi:hypothetical protein